MFKQIYNLIKSKVLLKNKSFKANKPYFVCVLSLIINKKIP